MPFWQLVRSGTALCGFDEARRRGEKHSVAIVEAVAFVRGLHPEMPISETEVKRILAAWRPRGNDYGEVFSFERFDLSEEDIQKRRTIEQLLMSQANKGSKLPIPNFHLPQNATVFKIRISKRPDYPRHNAKQSHE